MHSINQNQVTLISGICVDVPESPFKQNRFGVRRREATTLAIRDGLICWVGSQVEALKNFPHALHKNFSNKVIFPGFVDGHSHYCQLAIMGSYSPSLLEWLKKITFPEENLFSDGEYCKNVASLFLKSMLLNGTTSANVFCSAHDLSVNAFFEQAHKYGVQVVAGKVLMDQNSAPYELAESAEQILIATEGLIHKYHGNREQRYSLLPRFIPSCSTQLLEGVGELYRRYPDLSLHTHLSENKQEVEWVKQLHPQCKNYLDVYDHFGMLGENSQFAHAVHLCSDEWQRFKQSNAAIIHCPLANFNLGSGIFDWKLAAGSGVRVCLGSDVGAGHSLSMFEVMRGACAASALAESPLSGSELLYMATLGGARAVWGRDDFGSFEVGSRADFCVLDIESNLPLSLALSKVGSDDDWLFHVLMSAQASEVTSVWVRGNPVDLNSLRAN